MMNELVSNVRTADNPSAWTDQQLLAAIQEVSADRGRNTERLARLWVEAKKRGILPFKANGHTYWYEAVAAGTLRGGLVDMYHGDFVVLRRLSALTLDDQDRVLRGEEFDLATAGGTARLPVVRMTAAQVCQLIDGGTILPPDRQTPPRTAPARSKTVVEPDELRKFTPKMDAANGRLLVNRMAVPLDRVMAAMAGNTPDRPPPLDLRGDEVEKAGCTVVGVMLWKEEMEKLESVSKKSGLPTTEMIRKAIRAYLGHAMES
jgi:hypothetical protein